MKEALEKAVQSMLILGVTEEFTSPWRSAPPPPPGAGAHTLGFVLTSGV